MITLHFDGNAFDLTYNPNGSVVQATITNGTGASLQLIQANLQEEEQMEPETLDEHRIVSVDMLVGAKDLTTDNVKTIREYFQNTYMALLNNHNTLVALNK